MTRFDDDARAELTGALGALLDHADAPHELQDAILTLVHGYQPAERVLDLVALNDAPHAIWCEVVSKALGDVIAAETPQVKIMQSDDWVATIVPAGVPFKPGPAGYGGRGVSTGPADSLAGRTLRQCSDQVAHGAHAWFGEGARQRQCPGAQAGLPARSCDKTLPHLSHTWSGAGGRKWCAGMMPQ